MAEPSTQASRRSVEDVLSRIALGLANTGVQLQTESVRLDRRLSVETPCWTDEPRQKSESRSRNLYRLLSSSGATKVLIAPIRSSAHRADLERARASSSRSSRTAERPLQHRPCLSVASARATIRLPKPLSPETRMRIRSVPRSVQHPGSAARAALNDWPRQRKAKGPLLADLVGCNPLFCGCLLSLTLRSWPSRPELAWTLLMTQVPPAFLWARHTTKRIWASK